MQKISMTLAKPYAGWSALIFDDSIDNEMSCNALSYIDDPHYDIAYALLSAIMCRPLGERAVIDCEGFDVIYKFSQGNLVTKIQGDETHQISLDLEYAARTLADSIKENFDEWVDWAMPDDEEDIKYSQDKLKSLIEDLELASEDKLEEFGDWAERYSYMEDYYEEDE